MKKFVYILVALMALGLLISGCESVAPEVLERKGPSGQAGKSDIGHLYLYEKIDDGSDDWPIVEDGAWGKMKYNLSGEEFEFVFNGHGLEPREDYTLIYFPDPWPGNGLICLGGGTSNGGGNINIKNSIYTCNLPAKYDENYPDGAKIWLVLSEDVNCDETMMIDWNPEEYLFEEDLITFDYSGPEFVVTQLSGQNEINKSDDLPYIEWEISCSCIEFTFVNPSPYYFVFDYRVDGEEGELHDYSDTTIAGGELDGEKIGERYNWVVVSPGETKKVLVCGEEEIWAGMRVGAEQDYYLDWIIFEAQ